MGCPPFPAGHRTKAAGGIPANTTPVSLTVGGKTERKVGKEYLSNAYQTSGTVLNPLYSIVSRTPSIILTRKLGQIHLSGVNAESPKKGLASGPRQQGQSPKSSPAWLPWKCPHVPR